MANTSSTKGTGRERLRREKVRILLRTRNDAYPTLRARAIPSTPAGPAPGRARKCPACNGQGKIRVWQVCGVCEGRGKISVDSYTGKVSDSETRKVSSMTPERADAEIARLGLSLRLSNGETDPQEKYGWERAREAQNAAGSYQELARVLEWLREHHAVAWDFLMWAYGPLEPPLSRTHTEIEEYLVAVVADRMPSVIKVPKREWEAYKEKRIKRIKQLQHEATLDEIAQEVALPIAVVQQILAAQTC